MGEGGFSSLEAPSPNCQGKGGKERLQVAAEERDRATKKMRGGGGGGKGGA